MEVYNFVSYQTKPKRLNRINLRLPRKKSFDSTLNFQKSYSFKQDYKKERISRSTISVPKYFSFRSFLILLGEKISNFAAFAKKHYKFMSIALAGLILFITLAIFSAKISSFFVRHTSPLRLLEMQEDEIARLDKMMADFALENYAEINENGDILNASSSVQLYTEPVVYKDYKVQKGDTISGIAKKFGLSNVSTLISVNDIGNVRTLAAGQKLKIPSLDGIVYTVKSGDSIASIAAKNGIRVEAILDVNDLESEVINASQVIFLPGAKLDQKTLSLAMGDMFAFPLKSAYRISSRFGKRSDPISGKASSHKGDDYACPTGTPIYASMSGKVIYVGETWLYGKHVIIDHGNGYQTLYAHMSRTIASKGSWVSQGTKIGLVGSTGYSTGPHLHFTVYKNGVPIDPRSVLKY